MQKRTRARRERSELMSITQSCGGQRKREHILTLGSHGSKVPAEEFELLLVYLERSLLQVSLEGDTISLEHGRLCACSVGSQCVVRA